MKYDLDRPIPRKGTDSTKWAKFPGEVLPLWVADMDFIAAEPIIRALRSRVDHGVFGYARPNRELRQAIGERLQRLYRWAVREEEIVFLPGLVSGLNLSVQAFARPGEGILIQTPVYHHFITDPVAHDRALAASSLVPDGDSYAMDLSSLGKSISGRTKLFLFCNPHNPVGRAYTRAELERMAAVCLRHDLIICSDEIHCDLIYPGHTHTPLATVAPEVAERTVTLMAPSKTFNLAGLSCGFAVIQNPGLKRTFEETGRSLVPGANMMGQAAALAGYREGQEWLDQVLAYLRANRDFLSHYISDRLPGLRLTRVEATYLAWLDCRSAGIQGPPGEFFLREAKVALNEGREYGGEGEGYVRLNFACPRSTLTAALERMARALERRG